jgi:hypothetical protein
MEALMVFSILGIIPIIAGLIVGIIAGINDRKCTLGVVGTVVDVVEAYKGQSRNYCPHFMINVDGKNEEIWPRHAAASSWNFPLGTKVNLRIDPNNHFRMVINHSNIWMYIISLLLILAGFIYFFVELAIML